MIPLQLRVRNFMCYRDDVPPLDFEGIHLACLTGANGHGKSALLDAMTWALWGRARAKRDDELIHLGESEMEVEFTFDLGGSVYRVLRKRDSAKRGRTLLDLQVQHNGQFNTIAEPTIRATQATIVRLLRMDYDTFTNSAFLLQGKADAFTTRTPAERKQVLGDILGLSLYDEYEQRAKEKGRDRDLQVAELDGLLRDVDRELARQPEYEVDLAQAQEQVAQLSALVREAEILLREARQERQALESQQTRLQDLERRMAQAEQEMAEIEVQIAQREQRLGEYEAVLAERREVEDGYATLARAREAEVAWNDRLSQYTRLQGQRHELQRDVDAARHQLDLAVSRLKDRVQDLQGRAANLPSHQRRLAEVRQRLARMVEKQEERDRAIAQKQTLAEEAAGLLVQNKQLHRTIKELEERMRLLERETGEARCPVCHQALSDEHRDRVLAQIQSEGKELADNHRANAARGREIENEQQKLQEQIGHLDQDLAGQLPEQRREAQLEQTLLEAQKAASELESEQSALSEMQMRLLEGRYALDEQSELARLDGELLALAYDRDAHQTVRAEVAELAPFETLHQRLQTARERVDEDRAALSNLQARQQRWQKALADDRRQRGELKSEVERLPAVLAQEKARTERQEELQVQSSKARLALGAAQQKLDHCLYLTKERERHEATRRQRAEEKAVYDELRLAFGKKGIQAMIIEAVIPEIEFEANELLKRMTEGRMHVRFETQRETLKGDTLETLDINIADELGTRSYELFSGGEAFRVNFAIRIALSKLLARRAGAQLQLLVIDEGFGTQDADGRGRLVEAINSIQDDFARILVVTHIEELKDVFPVRVEVVKTDRGSQISLQ